MPENARPKTVSGRSSSASILAQRARPGMVLRLIGVHGIALSLLTAVPAAAAALEGAWTLSISLGVASLPPIALYLAMRDGLGGEDARQIEALVAVAASFLAGALLSTPAFMTLGLGPVDAFFEAVSGVTTTGLSVADGADQWPLSAHFLRAWLQWGGGFAFAALALALVIGPGVAAHRLGLVEAPGEGLIGSTRNRARQVLGAYLAITVIAAILLGLLAARPIEGVLIALAAVSTGGFAPSAESAALFPLAAQAATLVAMLAGAVSMTLYARAWKNGLSELTLDGECRALLVLTVAFSAAAVLIETLRPGGVGPADAIFTVASAQSTTGFSVVPLAAFSPAAVLLLVFAMLIGGSIGATAGGIKVFRAMFLFSAARLTLTRASLGSGAVTHLRIFGRKTEPHEGTDALGLVTFFFLSAWALWTAFVLAGHAPLAALFDTVSALSTVGLSSGVVGPDLPWGLKLAVAAAMLLGRLEFIAFLLLFRPATWFR